MQEVVKIDGKQFMVTAGSTGITVEPYAAPKALHLVKKDGLDFLIHPKLPCRLALDADYHFLTVRMDVLDKETLEPALRQTLIMIHRERGIIRLSLGNVEYIPLQLNKEWRICKYKETQEHGTVSEYSQDLVAYNPGDPVTPSVEWGGISWRLAWEADDLVLQSYTDEKGWHKLLGFTQSGILVRTCNQSQEVINLFDFGWDKDTFLPYSEDDKKPKVPPYEYSDGTMADGSPVFWKKNAKGQDIYLGMATDCDGLVNLIMCDKDGRKLSAGNLLLFTDTDKAVEYNWSVGDQYPGEKDMHDRIVIAD